MKLFKKLRKGFTLIELVVVIAVIAILSAVSVVSYVAITNKAHQSNDQQKVDQLNLSLAAAEISKKPSTMREALDALEDDGFVPEKFKAEAKNYEFAYSLEANKFVILEKGESVIYPKENKGVKSADIWRFAASNGDVKKDGASYYLLDDCAGDIETEVDGGVDVGKNKDITSFKLKSSQEKLVVNSGGDQCTVTIDCGSSDVDFYGFAKRIDVKDVKSSSLHIYGSIGQLQLEKGHAKVETTGIVFDVVQVGTKDAGAGATLTNNGFVAAKSLSEHTSETAKAAAQESMGGKAESTTLEVGTLAQLESFRDAVNSGNTFEGLSVKLTKDIALSDKWQPIGEGTRRIEATHSDSTGTFFEGSFDGQNHTISNLNNKNFKPTAARVKQGQYAYGLFGLAKNASFKNVKLTNVDIDGNRYADAELDSVGALVGYSMGNLTVENVNVSGSIKGADAVAGLVGRAKVGSGTVLIKDCSNAATVQAYGNLEKNQGVAAGIIRYYSVADGWSVTFKDCTNTGSVSVTTTAYKGAGIAAFEKTQQPTLSGTITDRGVTITEALTNVVGTGI